MTTTIEDIRNPAYKSGYAHVNKTGSAKTARGHNGGKPFHAQVYAKGERRRNGKAHEWVGPRRATAEEAAQDYCDYINGGQMVPSAALKTANHPKPVRAPSNPSDPELKEARAVLRAAAQARSEERKGYVYLVGESDSPQFLKIGHTYQEPPEARLNGLQTGNPRKLVMWAFMEGTPEDEARLHAKYEKYNVLGEWFHTSAMLMHEFPDFNYSIRRAS